MGTDDGIVLRIGRKGSQADGTQYRNENVVGQRGCLPYAEHQQTDITIVSGFGKTGFLANQSQDLLQAGRCGGFFAEELTHKRKYIQKDINT